MTFDHSFMAQESYPVNGWTEEEYHEACKDDAFYNLAKAALQTGDFTAAALDDPTMRAEVVSAKYHVAGGSARWMFQCSTDQLLSPAGEGESIVNHLNRVPEHHGARSVNNMSPVLTRIDHRAVFVSQYVANQLGFRFGEDLLKQAQMLFGDVHPVMDDILMEMDFVMRLGRSASAKVSVDLVMESGVGPQPVLQSGRKTIQFRLSTFATAAFTVVDEDWFVPQVVHTGGFHCVQYRTGKLSFVQVVRSTHSFNLKRYEMFRSAFVEKFPALAITRCEVWFVVPEELVGSFIPAESTGTLSGYKKGAYQVAGLRRVRA
jgi:hypothetical protein